jgi:hypothetical protein
MTTHQEHQTGVAVITEALLDTLKAKSGRECGACSLCCKVMDVEDPATGFHKPNNVWCRHCTKPGCGVYETRPDECRRWACQWLIDPTLGDVWFPKKCGIARRNDERPRRGGAVVKHCGKGAEIAILFAAPTALEEKARASKPGPKAAEQKTMPAHLGASAASGQVVPSMPGPCRSPA